jgi:hypothetical protein
MPTVSTGTDPRGPLLPRHRHAAADRLESPARAVSVPIESEQFAQGERHRTRYPPEGELHAQRRFHGRLLDAAGESYGECIGIADSRRGTPAAMRSLGCTQAVNPQRPFHRIELDGIFQVGHPPSVHLLIDPAFVADVAMAAALVERREDPLHFRRAVTGGHQPGTFGLMSVEISHRVRRAGLRKPGVPRLEPPHRRDHGWRRVCFPLPARHGTPSHVGVVLGPAARLCAGPRNPCLNVSYNVPLGPGIAIRLADVVPNPSHMASITGPSTWASVAPR